MVYTMVAKLFKNGRSKAVRLPAAFGFEDCKEVFMVQNPKTGDVVISRKPFSWDSFFSALGNVPSEFLNKNERSQGAHNRDPFQGWNE